jgi:hypothetical protein
MGTDSFPQLPVAVLGAGHAGKGCLYPFSRDEGCGMSNVECRMWDVGCEMGGEPQRRRGPPCLRGLAAFRIPHSTFRIPQSAFELDGGAGLSPAPPAPDRSHAAPQFSPRGQGEKVKDRPGTPGTDTVRSLLERPAVSAQ